jgi:hypothetical protein
MGCNLLLCPHRTKSSSLSATPGERLDELIPELVDGKTLALFGDAHRRDLAKRRRRVERLLLPRGDVLGPLRERESSAFFRSLVSLRDDRSRFLA